MPGALGRLAAAVLLATPLASPASPSGVYRGHLLGVRAVVRLHESRNFADVELRGLPLGGSLSGTAWFDAEGGVALSAAFARSLDVRRSKIVNVSRNKSGVVVTVMLPLFGERKITLEPVEI